MNNGIKPCWQKLGSQFVAVPLGAVSLPAGVYRVYESTQGLLFSQINQFKDRVFSLPGLPNDYILEQVNKFWDNKHVYDQYKFVHKRGILLYGPPGNGKTSVISCLVDNIIKEDGIVLMVTSFRISSQALVELKKIEPERKVMTLMEDMDTLLSGDYKSEEPYALSMLDGQDQVQGVLHVGTTNYPEQLAERFIKRPGRFDLIIGMGNPVKNTRRAYFKLILNDENHPELDYLTDKTEGLSLAYLKEIASSYLCLGIPVEDSVQRLKKNFTNSIKVSRTSNTGFKLGYDDNEMVAETEKSIV